MSLVAYAASSDEDSDNEEENAGPQVQLLRPQANPTTNTANSKPEIAATNGHISDEDDDFVAQELSLHELPVPNSGGRSSLALPKPQHDSAPPEQETVGDQVTLAFAQLPMPRSSAGSKAVIEEVDDEFLHKKALPAAGSAAVLLEKPPPPAVRSRVKISIPSLRDFSDVDKEKADRLKNREIKPDKPKGSGLLSILPQAKSERDFAKKPADAAADKPSTSVAPAFVPDTVKLRRAAHNTEGVDSAKTRPATRVAPAASLVNASDSEEDDEGAGDFFSLHSKQQLPEVSSNEISALVARRAAKIVEASNKYLEEAEERETAADPVEDEGLQHAQKRYHEQQLNAEAMDALVGKNAKRRRKEAQEMQVIDIAGSEVLPDREEWMRTALASATSFQPTGVLTDEEPVAGTRRKHQITYLAHKAKANEAELQAMWSANRQTRRATQSKYGF